MQRAQLWLLANVVTASICVIMVLARVLLACIERLHEWWPARLDWVSDAVYSRVPLLQEVFSHRSTRSKIKTIAEIAAACHVSIEVHDAPCEDGHILTLQRFSLRDSSPAPRGPPVLLIHGLLQDSDAFFCGGEESIVYSLLKDGYDVWCGNNRGTKYSSRHETLSPESTDYWAYNIDHLARYDVPVMIRSVLKESSRGQLALIGFSQGSAQTFAALSTSPALNERVSVFVALAPAVKTAAVGGFIYHLASAYPDILTAVFGKLSFLPIVLGWKRLLTPELFERVVSTSKLLLFGWDCQQIRMERRLSLYQYIYSLSSVQCVSHWFQVLGQNNGVLCNFCSTSSSDIQKRHDYDISKISCPVAVFSGERDNIIDAAIIPFSVPNCVHVHVEAQYEHLDMIWADRAHESVFPAVLGVLRDHCLK